MRPLGSGLEGASALLALLDDVHRHRLRRAALHLPLPSQERGPFQFSDRLLASLLFARAALSSFPFLLQTVLNRPQRYSDKDGRKTGSPDLPGVCPENYSDAILPKDRSHKSHVSLPRVSEIGGPARVQHAPRLKGQQWTMQPCSFARQDFISRKFCRLRPALESDRGKPRVGYAVNSRQRLNLKSEIRDALSKSLSFILNGLIFVNPISV